MMKQITLTLLLLSLLVIRIQTKEQRAHTDVILAGALGDLSKKYLWQGLFQLYTKHANENNTMDFYGVSRDTYDVGATKLNKILQERVSCKTPEDQKCEQMKHHFIQKVRYFQLKADEHFRKFGTFLTSKSEKLDSHVTQGRIFYLAIPPSAYTSMSEKFHNCCLLRGGKRWTRIALEKPFGSDTPSARRMAEDIAQFFREEEIYRVDHYLGKSVVKQILPFRARNEDKLERILNSDFVDRVEIVMKENFGVKGRFEYYNQYGVIRDVMQNHLTELLALVAMDLPNNLTNKEVDKNRKHVLDHIQPLTSRQILIGQYSQYVKEAEEEGVNRSASAHTPTFAAAVIYLHNIRWRNIPFLLVSGKELDERSSYVRIIFKNKEFCVSSCSHLNGSHFHGPKQIVFQIGHGNLPSPGVLVSKNLFTPQLPSGLKSVVVTSHDSSVYGMNVIDYNFAAPSEDNDAYVTVIEDLYMGHQQSFVSTERLMKLWSIWTPVLSDKYLPKLYIEKMDLSLNFHLQHGGIEYTNKYETVVVRPDYDQQETLTKLPEKFLDHSLVVKDTDALFAHAAENLYNIAVRAIQERNVVHVAFSGGTTPVQLFRVIVNQFPKFPWQWTHVWQVDERCVSPDDSRSNFKLIQTELLEHIDIPYYNIHPMPVFLAGELCSERSVDLYTNDLKFHIHNLSFDMVVLGVGADGHTASLFPGSPLLDDHHNIVTLTSEEASPRRLTFLYPLINKSKNIFVLMTGKSKHDIVDKLSKESNTKYEYPILEVNNLYGNLTFYIDNDAWFGE